MENALNSIDYSYIVVHTTRKFLFLVFHNYVKTIVTHPEAIVPNLFSKHGWESMPVVISNPAKYHPDFYKVPHDCEEAFARYQRTPYTRGWSGKLTYQLR